MELVYDFDVQINYDTGLVYTIRFDINENDIKLLTAFLFEKEFGFPYRELGWWLEPGAKEFVKKIEDDWFHNKLDLSSMREEYKQFLHRCYRDDAILEIENQLRAEAYDGNIDEDSDVIVYLDDEEVYID